MGFDDCYQLGNVVKTHGLKGEIVFFLDVDEPEVYQELESVFIDINGKLIPFFIESFHLQGDRAIVALEEIEDLDTAKSYVGKDLYLPLKSLPNLPKGKYYFHQLPGLKVMEDNQIIGEVIQVYQLPNNNLLEVLHQNKEVLIPLSDEIVKDVDVENKIIKVSLPDGLLDIYLNDQP